MVSAIPRRRARSEMKTIIDEMDGYYSYWETGKRATLRELLINEGIAVQVSRMISPGHAAWEYYGYDRREYARIREMGPVVARSLIGNFEKSGSWPATQVPVGRNERRCAACWRLRRARSMRILHRCPNGRTGDAHSGCCLDSARQCCRDSCGRRRGCSISA